MKVKMNLSAKKVMMLLHVSYEARLIIDIDFGLEKNDQLSRQWKQKLMNRLRIASSSTIFPGFSP